MVHARYAVVIVTYNRKKLLRECVRQVVDQTSPSDQIIIVNNASTDGTNNYLEKLSKQEIRCQIITCSENIGGAGGFARGIAQAVKCDVDCVLLIDDDAILSLDYMEKLLTARREYPKYKAFAGTVKVNGRIDTCHRKNISPIGLLMKDCPESVYQNACFACDITSFCGMLVDRELLTQIGLPHAEYFIWHDDAEYSLRIRRYSRFLIVSDAVLDHKTTINKEKIYPRRYTWRDYYNIRNQLLMVWEHGSVVDRVVSYTHIFLHILCRNWLFGLVRAGGHDWKYEKSTVKKAFKNARKMAKKQIPDVGVLKNEIL